MAMETDLAATSCKDVDCVGRVRQVKRRENAWDLEVEVEQELLAYVAPRGSVTVDGISLTVTGVSSTTLSLSIIPHTWDVTTLGTRKVGDPVNLEMDIIARYVDRLLSARGLSPAKTKGYTEAELRAKGY